MYTPSMHSMMTLRFVPRFDKKALRYGLSSIVAIATSMIGLAAFA